VIVGSRTGNLYSNWKTDFLHGFFTIWNTSLTLMFIYFSLLTVVTKATASANIT